MKHTVCAQTYAWVYLCSHASVNKGVTLMLSVFWDVLGPTRPAQSTTVCQNSMQMITIIFSALWLGETCQAANRKPSSSRARRCCPAETTCSPDTSAIDMIQFKPGYTCCTDRRSLTSLLHALFMVYFPLHLSSSSNSECSFYFCWSHCSLVSYRNLSSLLIQFVSVPDICLSQW